jgi:hypothetical protein
MMVNGHGNKITHLSQICENASECFTCFFVMRIFPYAARPESAKNFMAMIKVPSCILYRASTNMRYCGSV